MCKKLKNQGLYLKDQEQKNQSQHGNISEVGVGWGTSSGLFSRSLVKDSNGNPVTITVLSNEILDVTYELRIYPNETDLYGSFTLNGIDYSYISRPAFVTQNQNDGTAIGWGIYRTAGTAETTVAPSQSALKENQLIAYDGPIGSITSGPSGNSSISSSHSVPSYISGSHYADISITWGVGSAVFATGIKSIIYVQGSGTYQIEFTPAIPKLTNDVLSITFRHSWS